MRTSTAIRIGVLCALLITFYIVLTHRISTSRIGIIKGSSPYCKLAVADASESDIKVKAIVANPTEEPIGIPEWGLPRWRVTTRLFDVDRDGASIEHRGIMMKRSMQRGEELQIEAGTQASVRISMQSAGYDVLGHGKFTIVYRFVVFTRGSGIPCTSNALVVQK